MFDEEDSLMTIVFERVT